MHRVLLPALVSLIIVLSPHSKAYSQTAAPDSGSIPQTETEVLRPEPPAPVAIIADSIAVIKPCEPSLRLEGFSMYNFAAAYFYSRQKMTGLIWWDETSYEYTYTTTIFAAGASWNYLINNGLTLGGNVGFITIGTSRSRGPDSYYYYSDYSNSSTMTLIGPRIAQYFGNKNSKIMPFVAGEMDIITSSSELFSRSETIFRIGGGAVIKLVPNVGISLGLDYLKVEDQENTVNIMGTMGLVCMPFDLKK
ncbi:MAG: hypothetical protein A2509_08575 [Candidatus Edwardsbacteria bacterium RIFOXYD12_FULL_50_11]|uniref:Outer membrane protein beta-barrel domain-containing protein n=1 Tax=Candidatus Edwardsbacteria bacterium GWF2_54_11 TaxID=1817851 RepID=A0A1F5RFN4_9BACT|nr:MAG: hypothetical protein A2502_01945 [Candidatus Edwardsbacteria bacterium RifOxyC12_full_54_24]OGF09026.1 MAG: hypothetical protein A2273_10400 [Candidatus Edwardsbacteria bacterium RifOxyA12_full_54_48]OGF12448.1 MAG: hypothetical protein A3K15_01195 [Candidatus Edwardsbacteria bacterium GWE2_54_12]OGF12913.1 MAG: hypothetical protein A2024_11855 [Candidatus Edwardsbacteria bacterium GWF2_54_11]OGF17447.1 MAG: hypothetical protein A2509_08575 [Candidatus Edwardsbacteria bacterium RIFOXYD1